MAIALLVLACPAQAAPLTIAAGETWVFSVSNGDPADARKVAPSTRPAKGQIMVSVRRLMGTTMFVTNNSGTAWVFRAELLTARGAIGAKSCTLPARPAPVLEQWQQQADAVRIGRFQQTASDGSCA